jgi:hypothetical protein
MLADPFTERLATFACDIGIAPFSFMLRWLR